MPRSWNIILHFDGSHAKQALFKGEVPADGRRQQLCYIFRLPQFVFFPLLFGGPNASANLE
jgi:hypothetical protein